MNKIKTCDACKRLFNSPYDRGLCPSCYQLMEDKFDKVRKYVRENKGCGVEEVSEACKVSKKQILIWVREERLYFSADSGVGVPCLQCGIIIQSGKYCESCKAKLKKDLQGVYVEPKPENDDIEIKKSGASKMRFLSKDKR